MRDCPVCMGSPMSPADDESARLEGHHDWCPKRVYPAGTRVRFISSSDPYTKLMEGTLGTVHLVDDLGTVHINWDDGSHLGLSDTYNDRFEVVKEEA